VVQFTPAEDTSFEFSTAVTPRSGNDDAR